MRGAGPLLDPGELPRRPAVRAVLAHAATVQRERVIFEHEPHVGRNAFLSRLYFLIREFLDAPAVDTDDVVVMLPLVHLENRGSTLEPVARDDPRRLELRQDPIHGGQTDVLLRIEQGSIDIFRAHVALLIVVQNLEYLHAGRGDF